MFLVLETFGKTWETNFVSATMFPEVGKLGNIVLETLYFLSGL